MPPASDNLEQGNCQYLGCGAVEVLGVFLVCVWVVETTGEEARLGFTGKLQLNESKSLMVGLQLGEKQ